MVEVLNSTPEPDGSRKTYFLRVPPTTSSPRRCRLDVRDERRRVPAGGQIVIGSCDYCGEYCQSAEHLEYLEAAETCQWGHVGPWHGDDGMGLGSCSENHPYEDREPLDHDELPDLPVGRLGGQEPAAGASQASAGPPRPELDALPEEQEARLSAFIAEADRDLRSTRPADRDRVAAAFATYLGRDVPPIDFVASPRAVDAAVGEAENALFEVATDLPEWTRDTRHGWSDVAPKGPVGARPPGADRRDRSRPLGQAPSQPGRCDLGGIGLAPDRRRA